MKLKDFVKLGFGVGLAKVIYDGTVILLDYGILKTFKKIMLSKYTKLGEETIEALNSEMEEINESEVEEAGD